MAGGKIRLRTAEEKNHEISPDDARRRKKTKKRSWFAKHTPKIRSLSVWAVFFGLLYVLRSFLSLIFITFILTYTINSLLGLVQKNISWPRWGVVTFIYSLLIIGAIGMGMIVFPKVFQESKSITKEIPEAKDKLLTSFRELQSDPDYARFVEGIGLEETFKDKVTILVQWITTFLQNLFRISFHFILSLIFSFLIIWDLDRLKNDLLALQTTRIGPIYQILAPMLEQFGTIVGRAFEAQIMIACVNTMLTLVGLTILGVSSKLFLSVFVFFCSFIPVLGVIISSIPICLIAYKNDGFTLAFYCVLMIAIIHFIEAYILNPRIVGSHFSLHPFIAVCLLVISETWFGVWGLLLGVPCAVFVYQTFLLAPPTEVTSRKSDRSLKRLAANA